MSGGISPKWAVKSRMDSRIFWDSNRGILSLVRVIFGRTLHLGKFISFAAKREKWLKPFAVVQPSLFFPYFDFTLMNVYMNTGI